MKGYMNTKEAGEYLGGVSPSRIRQYIQQGRLVPEKVGHISLIPDEQVHRLRRELEAEQATKRGPKPKALKKNL